MQKLDLELIEKRYGNFSLRIDRLYVGEGEFMTVLGPSGSGKTTLLRIIAGLVREDGGRISIGGRNVTGLQPEKRRIGMVFQEARLFPQMTLEENITFGMKMQGAPKRLRKEKSLEMLRLMGMSGMEDMKPAQLSGGQQKRAAIARALLYRKDLLLMDEPFNEMDPNLRVGMRRFVKEVHREYGFTAVLVTHDRDEAFELSDRIAVMRSGEIVETAERDELYRRPRNLYTARFLGERNLFRYAGRGGKTMVGTVGLPVAPAGDEGWLMIPESAVSFRGEGDSGGGRLRMVGTVSSADSSRKGQELSLVTEIGEIHTFLYGSTDMEKGREIDVCLDLGALHFLKEG